MRTRRCRSACRPGLIRIAAGLACFVVAAGPVVVARAGSSFIASAFDEQRIEFEPGTDNATRAGNVDAASSDRWLLRASAGQVLDLTVDAADDNTVYSIFAPDRSVLVTVADGSSWSGALPTSGDYSIEVASLDGSAYYQLKVWIGATSRDPLGAVQRMSFAPGTDAGAAGGAVVRASADTWVLGAAAGQTMDVTVLSVEGNSTFDVIAPDGTSMTAPGERTTWSGQLFQDGDHHVVVQPTRGNATYTITVRITGGAAPAPQPQQPPQPPQPPPSTTRRIEFAPGNDNLTISEPIGAGDSHRWLAGAAAGQTMVVVLASDLDNVSFDVIDPNGVVLATGVLAATTEQLVDVQLTADGDHVITVTNLSGIDGNYVLGVLIR